MGCEREREDYNGPEMALVVYKGGIVRHGSVTGINGSDGTDSMLIN